MPWEVEDTDEFLEWWNGITAGEQDSVSNSVRLLIKYGVNLGHPKSSGVHSSRYKHMRELRPNDGRSPIRIFYAFDPRRTSILLIGGHKTDGDRFYRQYVPIADLLYGQYLDELREEGLLS